MSYISEIFERTNLQKIRSYLLSGVECESTDNKTYKQRLDSIEYLTFDKIETTLHNMKEYDELTNCISSYTTVTQKVYMEIGTKCGALLLMQLLNEYD